MDALTFILYRESVNAAANSAGHACNRVASWRKQSVRISDIWVAVYWRASAKGGHDAETVDDFIGLEDETREKFSLANVQLEIRHTVFAATLPEKLRRVVFEEEFETFKTASTSVHAQSCHLLKLTQNREKREQV